MYLIELIRISNQLETRKELIESLACKKGLMDPEVVKLRQELQSKMISYQQLLTLLPDNITKGITKTKISVDVS